MNTPTEAQRLNEVRFVLVSERRQESSYITIAANISVIPPLLKPATLIFLLQKVTSGNL